MLLLTPFDKTFWGLSSIHASASVYFIGELTKVPYKLCSDVFPLVIVFSYGHLIFFRVNVSVHLLLLWDAILKGTTLVPFSRMSAYLNAVEGEGKLVRQTKPRVLPCKSFVGPPQPLLGNYSNLALRKVSLRHLSVIT